jgi:hypothetical protein
MADFVALVGLRHPWHPFLAAHKLSAVAGWRQTGKYEKVPGTHAPLQLACCRGGGLSFGARADDQAPDYGGSIRFRVEFISRQVCSAWVIWQRVSAIGPSYGPQGEPETSCPSPELRRH